MQTVAGWELTDYSAGPRDPRRPHAEQGHFVRARVRNDETLPGHLVEVGLVQDEQGRVFIKRLALEARTGELDRRIHEVTRAVLRSVDLDQITSAVRDQLAVDDPFDRRRLFADQWPLTRRRLLDAQSRNAPQQGPGRPRERTDEYLVRVAVMALEVERRGGVSVHAALAAEFGRSRSKIRDDLQAAVQRGWLIPPPRQGARTGREPGPRLVELAELVERESGNDNQAG